MGISARLQHVLAGKYRVESFVGAGGVGLVYAATDLRSQERVAVKFLRSELASQPELTRRFIKEAEAVAQLEHPNAVRLIALDKDPKYGLYMVLELLSGESLEVHLARVKRLPLEQACEWLLPIMDMLEHAHAQGLLHRDIKPANIFLHEPSASANGHIVPKLLDFGLVRVMSDTQGLNTKTGQVLGTPAHMSPEQARGIKGLSASSDVWALAVVLYRCLSGVEPFDRGGINSTVLAVIRGEYRPLDEICPELPAAKALGEVLGRALRVNPKARTQSISQLRAQLLRVLDPAQLRRSGTVRRSSRLRRGLPNAAQAALVLAALGVLLMLVWWAQDATHQEPAPAQVQSVSVETARPQATPGAQTP